MSEDAFLKLLGAELAGHVAFIHLNDKVYVEPNAPPPHRRCADMPVLELCAIGCKTLELPYISWEALMSGAASHCANARVCRTTLQAEKHWPRKCKYMPLGCSRVADCHFLHCGSRAHP